MLCSPVRLPTHLSCPVNKHRTLINYTLRVTHRKRARKIVTHGHFLVTIGGPHIHYRLRLLFHHLYKNSSFNEKYSSISAKEFNFVRIPKNFILPNFECLPRVLVSFNITKPISLVFYLLLNGSINCETKPPHFQK